jgi:hypothetical protein
MKNIKFSIGSDPEVGIFDKKLGRMVSSIPILKRDKNNPIILDEKTDTKFYADNLLAEFSFGPAFNRNEFIERFRNAFKRGQEYLGDNYKFELKAAHSYPQEDLKPAYGVDPNLIGCTPSFDFYSLTILDGQEFTNNIRTQSTHIHIGHEKLTDFDTRHTALKLIEIFLGCSSVIFDKDESSLSRRQYYGLSGNFRPCDYGAEYRVLSSFALHCPELIGLTYDLVEYSLSHVFNGTGQNILDSIDVNDIRKSINLCDKSLAESVLYKAKLPKDLFKCVKANYDMNFYKNWKL